MDSLTDTDLDRIFVRIQQQIDLKNISSQGELKSAIANHAKNWNNTLNSFYWERIKDERDEVLSSVQGTDDYEDLEKIKRQAESNEVIDATTISFVNKKIDRIQREEVRKQEREIAKEEAEKFEREEAEERKKEFAESLEERKRVREEEPQRFGGFRSGEARRGRVALRTFDENL